MRALGRAALQPCARWATTIARPGRQSQRALVVPPMPTFCAVVPHIPAVHMGHTLSPPPVRRGDHIACAWASYRHPHRTRCPGPQLLCHALTMEEWVAQHTQLRPRPPIVSTRGNNSQNLAGFLGPCPFTSPNLIRRQVLLLCVGESHQA